MQDVHLLIARSRVYGVYSTPEKAAMALHDLREYGATDAALALMNTHQLVWMDRDPATKSPESPPSVEAFKPAADSPTT